MTVDHVLGSGRIEASGGAGAFSFGGGGGSGGRVALAYSDEIALPERQISASGGAGGQECPAGGDGSIVVERVTRSQGFHRGDPDNNGRSDLTDVLAIFNFLFAGGNEPACLEAADTNDDGALNLTDGVVLINYLFRNGPSPALPAPPGVGPCGADPEDSRGRLGCASYDSCR